MKLKQRKFIFPFIISAFTIISCQNTNNEGYTVVGRANLEEQHDLKEILQKNQLVVLAENSTGSYFIYRGHKMGLEYEILNEFAKEIGVSLKVKIVNDLNNMIPNLKNGEGDIIACNFTITKERRRKIDFSIPTMFTSQVLVQRKPKEWREMSSKEWKREVIQKPRELSRKTVHIWKNSSYYDRLINLQNELGDTIIIKPLGGDIIPEKAMELVEKGFIDYTVLDKNSVNLNKRYYPDLYTDLEISVQQKIAFGVRKSSPILRKKLDSWLKKFKKTAKFRYIKYKYFHSSSYASRSKSVFSSISGNRISQYDAIIKKAAERYGWDWRLIAALMYQESKFNINVKSWAGAYGLMQFMPTVGPAFGVYPDSPPAVQINGGVRKLAKDIRQWKSIPDPTQRIKFTLGTYNAGIGHVLDAQRLTKKYGKDPLVWDDNVELYIQKLSEPKYYQDPVCRYGYMRGSETFNYVRKIFITYHEYMEAFPLEEPNS